MLVSLNGWCTIFHHDLIIEVMLMKYWFHKLLYDLIVLGLANVHVVMLKLFIKINQVRRLLLV